MLCQWGARLKGGRQTVLNNFALAIAVAVSIAIAVTSMAISTAIAIMFVVTVAFSTCIIALMRV